MAWLPVRSLPLLFALIFAAPIGLVAQDQERFETLTVENVHRLVEIRTWPFDTIAPVYAAAFSPDGSELAIALSTGQVEIISLQTMQTTQTFYSIATEHESLLYNADGTELLLWRRTDTHRTYRLIDLETGAILAANTIDNEEYSFWPTNDLKKYVRHDYFEPGVTIYDMFSGEELLSVDDADIWRVNDDGTLLLTRNDDELIVKVWDIETGEIIFSIMPPGDNVSMDSLNGAGFTPEGLVWVSYPQYTLTGDEVTWHGPIQFWDISTGEIVLELGRNVKHYRAYRFLYFDPTDTYILAWSALERCWIWNLASQEELPCPAGGNWRSELSADGQMIVTYSGTGRGVYINQVEPPDPSLAVLEIGPTGFAECSPDGRFLVTLGLDLRLWGVPSSEE